MAKREAELFQLNPHVRMNVEECLSYCARNADEFQDVIVLGYDPEGELQLRSSHLSRESALWILMAAIDYVREKQS